MEKPRLWFAGGIAGALSICCYIGAIVYSWPDTQLGTSLSVVVVSAFPILGMISCYAICSFIAAEREGATNRIAFVFAIAGFTTLLAMLLVQMAVVSGLTEITRDLDAATAKVLRQALRMVDLGLDVAWDLLMSTALIFWGFALRKRSGFGPGWAFPLMALGVLLIVLNVATFPCPPGSRGSFDMGPVAGIFLLALNIRLAFPGRRALAGSARVS